VRLCQSRWADGGRRPAAGGAHHARQHWLRWRPKVGTVRPVAQTTC